MHEPGPDVGYWLVDGNNVVGSRPDGWWRDRPAAFARLSVRLGAHPWPPGIDVVVFFDGAGEDRRVGRVGVRFSGRAYSADDAIVGFLSGRRGGKGVVVTSDRALARRCHALGADVMGTSWLLDALDKNAAEGAKPTDLAQG